MEASKLALLVVLATTAAMANPSNAQNSCSCVTSRCARTRSTHATQSRSPNCYLLQLHISLGNVPSAFPRAESLPRSQITSHGKRIV